MRQPTLQTNTQLQPGPGIPSCCWCSLLLAGRPFHQQAFVCATALWSAVYTAVSCEPSAAMQVASCLGCSLLARSHHGGMPRRARDLQSCIGHIQLGCDGESYTRLTNLDGLTPLKLLAQDRLPAMVHPASSAATLTLVRTALRAYSCGVCMSSVTSCVGGGLFICFTCLHVQPRTPQPMHESHHHHVTN
jgi:hypothetical protein